MKWVQVGSRVELFEDPYSMEKSEGTGTVTDVINIDEESAFVEVQFDGDDGYGPVMRWVIPGHVLAEQSIMTVFALWTLGRVTFLAGCLVVEYWLHRRSPRMVVLPPGPGSDA